MTPLYIQQMILPWILMIGSLYFGFFTTNPPSPFWGFPTGGVLWILSVAMFAIVVITNRKPEEKG